MVSKDILFSLYVAWVCHSLWSNWWPLTTTPPSERGPRNSEHLPHSYEELWPHHDGLIDWYDTFYFLRMLKTSFHLMRHIHTSRINKRMPIFRWTLSGTLIVDIWYCEAHNQMLTVEIQTTCIYVIVVCDAAKPKTCPCPLSCADNANKNEADNC